MLEQIQNIVVDGVGEIVAVAVTVGIAAIKRMLEKRKLRRQGKLRDEKYLDDNLRHLTKW